MSINSFNTTDTRLALVRAPVTIQDLPFEVVERIAACLSLEELQKAVRINKLFHEAVIRYVNNQFPIWMKNFTEVLVKQITPPLKADAQVTQDLALIASGQQKLSCNSLREVKEYVQQVGSSISQQLGNLDLEVVEDLRSLRVPFMERVLLQIRLLKIDSLTDVTEKERRIRFLACDFTDIGDFTSPLVLLDKLSDQESRNRILYAIGVGFSLSLHIPAALNMIDKIEDEPRKNQAKINIALALFRTNEEELGVEIARTISNTEQADIAYAKFSQVLADSLRLDDAEKMASLITDESFRSSLERLISQRRAMQIQLAKLQAQLAHLTNK